MRIVSLLPSATEIVFALGLGDDLHGVSFECDFPPPARSKAVVSGTALAGHGALGAREVDDAVSAEVAAGRPIYTLDREAIAAIAPDLILAQDLCRVCAVPSGAVQEALEGLGCRAEVVSLDPGGLDAVIDCIGAVGRATGTEDRAGGLMEALRARVERVRARVAGRPRPRTLALEWSDPPYGAGHWVPEMVDAAGGLEVLGVAGADSRRLAWPEVEAGRPEVVVFMPCGYDLARAVAEGRRLLGVDALAPARRIHAVDATAYFSRPGPRIVDGVEILAWALHPEVAAAPPAGTIATLR